MNDVARKLRAEQRIKRAVIRQCRSGELETEMFSVTGPDAISLATSLIREAWAISGRQFPDYDREETPYRFVPWPE